MEGRRDGSVGASWRYIFCAEEVAATYFDTGVGTDDAIVGSGLRCKGKCGEDGEGVNGGFHRGLVEWRIAGYRCG